MIEDLSPSRYAAHLATYIADPSTIRARTLQAYGRGPSIDDCREYRRDHERRIRFEARQRYFDRYRIFSCAHPETEENILLTLNGLEKCRICQEAAEREKAERAARELEQYRREQAARTKAKAVRESQSFGPLPRLHSEVLLRVARCFGLTVDELQGASRQKRFINARAVAAKVYRDRGLSYPQIAKILKRKCHSTIIHAVETFNDRAQRNPELFAVYDAVTGK